MLVVAQGFGEPALVCDQSGEQGVFEDGFEWDPFGGYGHYRGLVHDGNSGGGDAEGEQGDQFGVRKSLVQCEFGREGAT